MMRHNTDSMVVVVWRCIDGEEGRIKDSLANFIRSFLRYSPRPHEVSFVLCKTVIEGRSGVSLFVFLNIIYGAD